MTKLWPVGASGCPDIVRGRRGGAGRQRGAVARRRADDASRQRIRWIRRPRQHAAGPGDAHPDAAPGQRSPGPGAVTTTRFARLSHRQWENTVRDLLRLPAAPGLSVKFSSDTRRQVRQRRRGAGGLRQPARRLPDRGRGAGAAGGARPGRPGAADAGERARRRPRRGPGVHPRRSAGGPTAVRWTIRRSRPTRRCSIRGRRLVPGVRRRSPPAPSWCSRRMLQSHHFLYRTELHAPGRAASAWATTRSPPSCPSRWPAPCRTIRSSRRRPPAGCAARPGERRRRSGCWARAREPAPPSTRSCSGCATLDLEKDPKRVPRASSPAWQESIVKESELFLGEIFASGKGLAELLTSPFTFVDAHPGAAVRGEGPGRRRLRAGRARPDDSGRASSPRSPSWPGTACPSPSRSAGAPSSTTRSCAWTWCRRRARPTTRPIRRPARAPTASGSPPSPAAASARPATTP